MGYKWVENGADSRNTRTKNRSSPSTLGQYSTLVFHSGGNNGGTTEKQSSEMSQRGSLDQGSSSGPWM